jgi:hypothetical protein
MKKEQKFWEDTWLENKSLAQQYPSLYSIVQRKQDSIANVLSNNPLNISFRIWLHLVKWLMQVQLLNEKRYFCMGANLAW